MSHKKYRAQILLEPEQHEILAEKARREGSSVSHVVREIVAQYITVKEQESLERQEALKNLKQLQKKIAARRGGKLTEEDLNRLIDEPREERADELITQAGHNRG